MLNSQINLYSIDTGHFYSNREKRLSENIFRYQAEIRDLEHENENIDSGHENETVDSKHDFPESAKRTSLIRHKRDLKKETERKLRTLLANKSRQNEKTGGKDHVRHLRGQDLRDNKIISVFESALSRTIGIETDKLTDALFVVQVFYDDIFKDLFFFGFVHGGEKYRYFTSSAGQIRTKKAVFIKESVWERIEQTILCGLTTERINAKGGINVNKYLKYIVIHFGVHFL